jgi:hypothetical protein
MANVQPIEEYHQAGLPPTIPSTDKPCQSNSYYILAQGCDR